VHEMIPVLAGFAVGLLFRPSITVTSMLARLLLPALLIGLLANRFAGELIGSNWERALWWTIDAGQVFAAGAFSAWMALRIPALRRQRHGRRQTESDFRTISTTRAG
jgi:hypothetical protein